MPAKTFLDRLPAGLRSTLLDHAQTHGLAGGETLFRHRDPPGPVYLIASGELEAIDERVQPPVVYRVLTPGSVVGELAFVDRAPRAATVRARGPTILRAWSQDVLRELVAADPVHAAALWQALAGSAVDVLRETQVRVSTHTAGGPVAAAEDDLGDAVARHIERIERVLSAPAPGGPDPLVGALELLWVWLKHQGVGPAGQASGAELRAGLGSLLRRSRCGALLAAHQAGTGSAVPLLDHLVRGEPAGDDDVGLRLDRALLGLPTARALRWRAARVVREVDAGLPEGRTGDICLADVSGPVDGGWATFQSDPGLAWTVVDRSWAVLESGVSHLADRGLAAQGRRLDPMLLLGELALQTPPTQDVIVLSGVLDTLPDALARAMVAWAGRALRPGGLLVLGALGSSPDDALWDLLLDWPTARREPRPTAFLLRGGPWSGIKAVSSPGEHGASSLVLARRSGGSDEPVSTLAHTGVMVFGSSLHDLDAGDLASLTGLGADLARAALLVVDSGELDQDRRRALCAGLSACLDLPLDACSQLVNRAVEAEIRAPLTPAERRLLLRRLGPQAVALWEFEQSDELDLETFAERHGPAGSVALLDLVLKTFAADGELDAADRSRVGAAAERLQLDPGGLALLLHHRAAQVGHDETVVGLSGDRLIIGRALSCDVVLSDPQVALRHASLTRQGDAWWAHALAHRPLAVDGRPVQSAPLAQGSALRLGAHLLQLQGDTLRISSERAVEALQVEGLAHAADGRPSLSGVGFTAFVGELVALVGPSGCGKTTLLDALSGARPAAYGSVRLGGDDFHQLLRADPSLVGQVPQDDLVLPEQTVEESLRSSARLRLSADASDSEVDARVEAVLAELGLTPIRRARIGDPRRRGISGGQRKRVNLGQELITRSTRVMFLDEPTSGLDPRAAADVARLARQLADDGRLVFLVTHDLAPGVLAQVDQLLVMAAGGRQVFFGPPDEACAHFGAASVAELFDRLEDRTAEEWQALWERSPACLRYRTGRQALVQRLQDPHDAPEAPARARYRTPWRRHLVTLTGRYGRARLRDPTGAAILVAQPVVLAAVMAIVFTRATSALLFMLALSCLWFGMSAAVRELIADRPVWRRERRVGVRVGPYLLSKVAVLAAVVLAQTAGLTLAVHASAGLGELGFSLPALVGTGALGGLAGLGLGLLVSALWTSSEAAVGTLILLLVPQIAFSGVLLPVRDMSAPARALTWVTPARYAFDLSLLCGEELDYANRGEWFRRPVRGDRYVLGLRGATDEGLSASRLAWTLVALVLGLLVLTGVRIHLRDRPRRLG